MVIFLNIINDFQIYSHLTLFYAAELHDVSDQLSDGGRSVAEVEKIRRRLEMEKQELQAALEEAESTLEQEEAKVARAQMEIQGIRSEIDRRIAEKEEEFENVRYVLKTPFKNTNFIIDANYLT